MNSSSQKYKYCKSIFLFPLSCRKVEIKKQEYIYFRNLKTIDHKHLHHIHVSLHEVNSNSFPSSKSLSTARTLKFNALQGSKYFDSEIATTLKYFKDSVSARYMF